MNAAPLHGLVAAAHTPFAADGSVLGTFNGTCGFRIYVPRVGFF
jgi:hypothetical protein